MSKESAMAEAQIEDPRGRTIPRRTPANDLWGIEFWFKQPKDMKQKDKDPKVKKPECKIWALSKVLQGQILEFQL